MKLTDRFKGKIRNWLFKDTTTIQSAEKSFYTSPYYSKSYLAPYNPDDIYQKKGSIDIYQEMLNDDQVKAVLYTKKYSIIGSGGEVKPNDEDEQGQEKADYCNYCLTDGLTGSFSRALWKIISAFEYGYSVTEKLFKKFQNGKYEGKIGIYKFKTRPPQTFLLPTDKHGNLVSVTQMTEQGDIPLETKYFVVYTYNMEFDGNYYGTSDLRAAYTPWWSKKFNRRFRNIRNERFGMPLVIGRHPVGASPDEVTALFNTVKNLQAKSAATLPEGDTIEFIESKMTQGKSDVFETSISYDDKSIARSMLMPDMLGFSDSKFGSRASSETGFDLFLNILEFIRSEITEEVVDEQILKQLVDLNFPNVTNYPKYKFNPITGEDKQKLLKLFLEAVKEKTVYPTEKDEIHIRQVTDFPEEVGERPEPVDEPTKTSPGQTDSDMPEDTDVDEPEKGKVMGFREEKFKLFRKPNKYEQGINFKEISDELIIPEITVTDQIQTILQDRTLDSLIQTIKNKRIVELKKIDAIEKLQLKGIGDIRRILNKSLRNSFDSGRSRGKQNIAVKSKEANMQVTGSFNLPPEVAINYFRNASVIIAGKIRNTLSDGVKAELMIALKDGLTLRETLFEVEKVFNEYIDTQVVAKGVKKGWRAENIVRTNLATAYNMGNDIEYQENKLVEAIEISAILDDRTSDYCYSIDGEIYRKTDPNYKPGPYHYRCRTVGIPILVGEEYIPSTENILNPRIKNRETGERTSKTVERQFKQEAK